MEQIIFFTQPQKLEDINLEVVFTDGSIKIDNTSPDSKNRILIIDESSSIDNLSFTKGYINYLIYHNLTLDNAIYSEFIKATDDKKKLEDHHIKHQTKIYHEIGNILIGFNDQKFEELKNKISNIELEKNKLEAVLKFLHECLGGAKPDIDLYTEFAENEKSEIGILLKGMPVNMNEDLEKFKSLRDKVLDLVGINE